MQWSTTPTHEAIQTLLAVRATPTIVRQKTSNPFAAWKYTLPLLSQPYEKNEEGTVSARKQGTEPLILVENERQILELMSDILKMHGYKIKAFADADSVWRYIDTHTSERKLLITDLQMTGDIDGVGLVQRAHEKSPRVPIVVASGYDSQSDALDINEAYWLPKPFMIDHLHMRCQRLAPLD